jgi:tetratricopeptide (TPR) repeat protein
MGHLLLDVGLNGQAVELMARGMALARETGINFWRAAIAAHLAVAQTRLGQTGVTAALQAELDGTRRNAERYLMVGCLYSLAEVTLAEGDARRCRELADELLSLAEANGLREAEARARRWRGEALLAEEAHAKAGEELSRAAALAGNIGRLRLEMDAEDALARVFGAQGERDAARRHAAKARAIADRIEQSLASSGLETQLRLASDFR